MISKVDDQQLTQLRELVANRMGLQFPASRLLDLESGLALAAQEFGFKDVGSCVDSLVSSPLTRRQIETLAGYLTIGETYFFRDKNSFSILEERILPQLIRSRQAAERYLRIWSAGCATGEEPYSIAILLRKLIPDLSDWNITILATDINPHFLQKASRGIYGDWSFRDCPAWTKERYFKRIKRDHFEIVSDIKKMVAFAYHNLADDTYPSLLNNTNAMDIIFCRNVLMYFDPEVMKKAIQNFRLCLVNDGWLIVGPTEYSQTVNLQFAVVSFPNAIMYKKESQGPSITGLPPKEDSTWTLLCGAPSRIATTSNSIADKEVTTTPPEPVLPPAVDIGVNEKPDPYEKALTFFGRGRYAEAEEEIAKLLARNEGDPRVMALRAKMYANQGKLGEALRWCQQSIATDKLNPAYHYLLATILQEHGQVEEAVCSLKRALYLDHGFALAYFALGNLTWWLGKLKESRKHFDNALLLLSKHREEEILPESEGITVGRLREIIGACLEARS